MEIGEWGPGNYSHTKVIATSKLTRTTTYKKYFNFNVLIILVGIALIYVLLFMTRYYILSPIEIDKNYRNKST